MLGDLQSPWPDRVVVEHAAVVKHAAVVDAQEVAHRQRVAEDNEVCGWEARTRTGSLRTAS